MATRAQIITKSVSDLGDLALGLTTTDTAPNPFHYALNDALARMGKVDADVANFSNDDVRVASLGAVCGIVKRMIAKYIQTPRVDKDLISRDKFSRLTELYRLCKLDFENALSTGDVPPEINRPAESVVTWTSGTTDDQNDVNDFNVDEFGRDLTSYTEDGE